MLSVNNLTVAYGDIKAVKGITFEVRRGEIFTLIGANGAGKTSALRAISGLLRFGGSVRFEDHELGGVPPEKIVAMGLAHAPEGRGIFGNLTVLENLRLGSWVRKDHKKIEKDMERVLSVLPRLRERKDQPAGTLSGGEQQMLAVARALMSGARLLLLDEPSMGLAPMLVREIYKLLREINETGVTILLVEQNANVALRLAHQAAVLETGQITLTDRSAALLENPGVREAYLGVS
jgi:branched-chain amino acid transport system ATP-binding protein